MKVKVATHTRVVGGSVQFHEDDGRFAGQITFLYNTSTLRNPKLQKALSELMAKALEQFFDAQEPLGAEFEAAWGDNADSLYQP